MLPQDRDHVGHASPSMRGLKRASHAALVDSSRELALPPATATRILRLASNPRTDLKEIAKVVNSDPMIAGRVLSAANSAAYGGGRAAVSSIEKALGRLGLETLRGMIVQLSVATRVLRAPGLEGLVRPLLRHAVFAAVAGRAVARATGLDGERAFSIGLLHDIGRLVGLEAYLRLSKAQQAEIALEPRGLRTVLDFTHEEIGGDVAKKWNLESLVVESIAHHHLIPERLRSLQYPSLARVADLIAHQLDPDLDDPQDDVREQQEVFQIGVSPNDLDRILRTGADTAKELLSALS